MSGHSKWSKVKHQKEATDALKGKIFTKMATAIIITLREGGGTDPDSNFRLRLIIDKAKAANMPKENIQRAIEKAKGTTSGEISEIVYEAFGPNGSAILIKCATDNKQRTVSEIKNLLDREGGSLAGTGSVLHFFNEVGFIEVAKTGENNDEILEKIINAGAIDYDEKEESFYIYTVYKDTHKVSENLSKIGLTLTSIELIFKPITLIESDDLKKIQKLEGLINLLEERDDVIKVFSNFRRGAHV